METMECAAVTIAVAVESERPSLSELDMREQFVYGIEKKELWNTKKGFEPSDFLPKERRAYVRLWWLPDGKLLATGRLSLATTADAPPDVQGGVFDYTKGTFPFAARHAAFSVSRVMTNPQINYRELIGDVCLGELLYMACFAAAKKLWGARWALLVVKQDLMFSHLVLQGLGCEKIPTKVPLFSYDIPYQDPVQVVPYLADLQAYLTREALGAAWSRFRRASSRLDPQLVRFTGLDSFVDFQSATPWKSNRSSLSPFSGFLIIPKKPERGK